MVNPPLCRGFKIISDYVFIGSTTKSVVGKCILPAGNITSIVKFAAMSISLSEHLWVLVLRILDLIIKNDVEIYASLQKFDVINGI